MIVSPFGSETGTCNKLIQVVHCVFDGYFNVCSWEFAGVVHD